MSALTLSRPANGLRLPALISPGAFALAALTALVCILQLPTPSSAAIITNTTTRGGSVTMDSRTSSTRLYRWDDTTASWLIEPAGEASGDGQTTRFNNVGTGTYTLGLEGLVFYGGGLTLPTDLAGGAGTFEVDQSVDQSITFDVPEAPLSGTVVDEWGFPLDGATVTLQRAQSDAGPFAALPGGSVVFSAANSDNPVTTAASGEFEWNVLAGWYRLQVSRSGYDPYTSAARLAPPDLSGLVVMLEGGVQPALEAGLSVSMGADGQLELTPPALPPGFDVVGHRWERDGAPIPGATGDTYRPVVGDTGSSIRGVVEAKLGDVPPHSNPTDPPLPIEFKKVEAKSPAVKVKAPPSGPTGPVGGGPPPPPPGANVGIGRDEPSRGVGQSPPPPSVKGVVRHDGSHRGEVKAGDLKKPVRIGLRAKIGAILRIVLRIRCRQILALKDAQIAAGADHYNLRLPRAALRKVNAALARDPKARVTLEITPFSASGIGRTKTIRVVPGR